MLWRIFLLAALLWGSGAAYAANDLTRTPYAVDTASGSVQVAGDIYIACFKWVGATALGHTVVVRDGNGRVIWTDLAPSAGFVVNECGNYFFQNGFRVSQIDSGILYVTARESSSQITPQASRSSAASGGGGGGGTGTVTSVGLAAPAEFTVSGSPVLGAGTLTLTKASQSPNFVYIGPSSGGAAAPAFRAMVPADVPLLPITKLDPTGAGTGQTPQWNGSAVVWATVSGGGVTDGDKGDISIIGGVWSVDSGAVTGAEVAFTPTGTVGAANVQAAIAEVAAESGGSQTLQQVVTNGRNVTDAVDTGTQVCLGGPTNKTCFYGNTARSYPDADTNLQPLATFDLNLKDAGGTTRLNVDGDTGIVTANITGALTGNALTATALASNPVDCSANQFANAIASSGNLTCSAIADADVPDAITASNYLPLAGGTLTGQVVVDNLGLDFDESDTNPTCASGNYSIYADTSEAKLKKCTNGTVSDLDTTGGGGGAYKCGLVDCVAPVLANFTGVNVASASASTALANTIYLTSDSTVSSAISINLWKLTAPATPYTRRACFIPQYAWYYGRVGVAFRQSSDGKLETLGLMHTSSTVELRVDRWDSPTTINAGPLTYWLGYTYSHQLCLEVADNGTNRTLSVSNDNVIYRPVATHARTTFLTADEIGFFVASGNNWDTMQARLMHWQ